MTTRIVARPKSRALRNMRGKRIRLSDAELAAMYEKYPENTETMPDSLPQKPFLFYFMATLTEYFHRIGQTAAVVGDVFIFYREDDMQAKFAADMSVTMDIDLKELVHDRNYYSWIIGALPDLVIEAGSSSTSRNDLGRKFRLYASLGIPEYWLFDVPYGDYYGFLLRGYRLVEGEYRLIEAEEDSPAGMTHYRSLVMDLDFCIPEGAIELFLGDIRLYSPATGEYFRTIEEWSDDFADVNAHLEAARARADIANARANDARARANDANARAEMERNLRIDAQYRAEAEREARREAEARIRELEDRLREQGRG